MRKDGRIGRGEERDGWNGIYGSLVGGFGGELHLQGATRRIGSTVPELFYTSGD